MVATDKGNYRLGDLRNRLEELKEQAEVVENTDGIVARSDFDSRTMNPEDEFRRLTGMEFDPEKYSYRIDEGVNGFDDGPYEEIVFFEKQPEKVATPAEYDLVEIGRNEFDSQTMDPVAEFERITGMKYDPDKYEYRIDEGANGYDDGPYEEIVFFEKFLKRRIRTS